ncbi:MAG: hypothetical protein KC503_01195 [Myxococcales bacterium]|nr:hypothetical protein [Myxococcales bacterium]
MARSRYRALAACLATLVAAACSGGLGKFCHADGDCSAGLVCRSSGQGQRGVCAYADTLDGSADATFDGAPDAADAALDGVDATGETTPETAPETAFETAPETAPETSPDATRDATPDGDSSLDAGVDADASLTDGAAG